MFDESPLLTKKQRRLLWEAIHEEESDEDHRREYSRMRSRIRDIISDFSFLFRYLPSEDRRKIFEDLDEFAEYRIKEKEDMLEDAASAEDFGEDRQLRRAPDQSYRAEEGERLYVGIVGALAFLYSGVGNSRAFENILEKAIKLAARDAGTLPLEVEVSISVTRERDREDLLEQWKEGEIEKEELLAAIDADPTFLFESLSEEEEDEGE